MTVPHPHPAPRAVLALSGWCALAATALPAGNPLRVAAVLLFLLTAPGAAMVLRARTVPVRSGARSDVLATAALAVALSAAAATVTATALYLAQALTVPRALGALALVTTLLVVLPAGRPPRLRRRERTAGSRRTAPAAGAGEPGGPGEQGKRGEQVEQGERGEQGKRELQVEAGEPGEATARRTPGRARRTAVGLAAAALLALTAACSGAAAGPHGPAAPGGPVGGSGLPAAVPADNPPGPGPWREVFRDDFTAGDLDTADWATCYDWNRRGCTNAGNAEDQWYLPGQVAVRDGALVLTADRRTTPGSDGISYPWTAGMVTTGRDNWDATPRHTFTYGWFAAAIELPDRPTGFFPAFWLIPEATRGTPPEIDIAEFPNTDRYVHGNLHWPAADGTDRSIGQNYGPGGFGAGYHVYAVDWQPDRVTWYVDGQPWFTVTDPAKIPSVAMELVINLAVGYLQSPPAAVGEAQLKVDWVAVWQR
ncbi:glycoside hydrolase family 16 protein [Kitasatospora sp. NPDC054939]